MDANWRKWSSALDQKHMTTTLVGVRVVRVVRVRVTYEGEEVALQNGVTVYVRSSLAPLSPVASSRTLLIFDRHVIIIYDSSACLCSACPEYSPKLLVHKVPLNWNG